MTIRINGNVVINNSRDATLRNMSSSGTISFTSGVRDAIDMNNNNITRVNHIRIADPGRDEGLEWVGGNGWAIYESPDNLSNSSGNLQFVTGAPGTGATRRMTLRTDGRLQLGTQANATNQAVRADRTISTGSGLSGGGNLTANRTFSVDGTVVRTSGNQTIGGVKTFSSRIRLASAGSSWINGHRDTGNNGVYLTTTGTTSSFHRWVSQRTPSGGFSLGTLNNDLYITWATATNINNNTNSKSDITVFRSDGRVILGNQANATNQAVRADRTISTTNGISGGGNLTANRTFQVDATVVRTSGNQTIGGTKTFSAGRINSPGASSHDHGSISIGGSKNSYAGIAFPDANAVFMVRNSDARSGIYRNNNTWIWRFNGDGTLANGTVPWARLSGIPSTLSGTVNTSGNQTIGGNKTFTGTTTFSGQVSMSGANPALEMNNRNISGINHMQIRDPGPREGLEWVGGNGWCIDESPDNRSNTGGNLQFVTGITSGNGTRRATIYSNGNFWFGGTLTGGTVPWARISGAPSFLTTVNLGRSEATTSVTITNTAGTDATIRDATTGRAGLVTTGNQTWGGTKTTTRFDGSSQMRSPIYYDRGNTSYLVRPANTGTAGTRLRGVRMDRLGIGAAASGSTGDLYVTRSVGVGTTPSGTTGQLRATNNIIAYSSDQRLKTNIVRIQTPVEKVQQLDGVEFDWDETTCNKWGFYPEGREVGLLAQQVQAVVPAAVKPAPFDQDSNNQSRSGNDYLTVQYEKLVPLLVEAIKAQQNRIEALESQINSMINNH